MTIITKKILYIYQEEFYNDMSNIDNLKNNLWPIGLINNKKYFYTNDEKLFLNNNSEDMVLISLYENYYNIQNHILNKYIYKSILLNITDIHIINSQIIYKKNRKIISDDKINQDTFNDIYNFLKMFCNFRLINRKDESGVFYVNFLGEIIGIRVSTFIGVKDLFDNNNTLISLRFLKDVKNNFYKEFIYKEENYRWLMEKITSPGLIVIGGETGRGKTTFLYNILQLLVMENFNIISIEDPVEKIIPGVFQRELNTYFNENSYNYNEILRSILRHNPDVIVVGEIRDTEGALLVTRSLLTGHSILSTLHLSNWENNINNEYLIGNNSSNPIKENFLKRFEDFGVNKKYIENYIKGFIFLNKDYKVNLY